MIGLMVSIFSIVMILIYFASPISRDHEARVEKFFKIFEKFFEP